MENVEFNLKCLKTTDSKQGAVRAVRFNGEFDACQAKCLMGTEMQDGFRTKCKCHLHVPDFLGQGLTVKGFRTLKA
jgi:hypothetical protein